MVSNRWSARGQREELVTEIVSAVAEDAGVDVFDLPPLAEVIDPETMQTLLYGSDSVVRIHFEYAGREVVLEGDGSVEIRDRRVRR